MAIYGDDQKTQAEQEIGASGPLANIGPIQCRLTVEAIDLHKAFAELKELAEVNPNIVMALLRLPADKLMRFYSWNSQHGALNVNVLPSNIVIRAINELRQEQKRLQDMSDSLVASWAQELSGS